MISDSEAKREVRNGKRSPFIWTIRYLKDFNNSSFDSACMYCIHLFFIMQNHQIFLKLIYSLSKPKDSNLWLRLEIDPFFSVILLINKHSSFQDFSRFFVDQITVELKDRLLLERLMCKPKKIDFCWKFLFYFVLFFSIIVFCNVFVNFLIFFSKFR